MANNEFETLQDGKTENQEHYKTNLGSKEVFTKKFMSVRAMQASQQMFRQTKRHLINVQCKFYDLHDRLYSNLGLMFRAKKWKPMKPLHPLYNMIQTHFNIIKL